MDLVQKENLVMKEFKIIHRFSDISEIENNLHKLDEQNIGFDIIQDETEKFSGIDGNTISDVIILFNNHWNDIIVYPATYELIKGTITLLWNKVKARFIKAKEINIDGSHKGDIEFKLTKKGEIKFDLNGDLDTEQIDSVIDKLLRLAENKQEISKLTSNPDYLEKTADKPRVRMTFNKESKKWEPVNFQFFDDYWKKKMDEANNNINN